MSDQVPTLSLSQLETYRQALDTAGSSDTFHLSKVNSSESYSALYSRLRKHPLIEWLGKGRFRVRRSSLWFREDRVNALLQARDQFETANKVKDHSKLLITEATTALEKIARAHLRVSDDLESTPQEYARSLTKLRLSVKAVEESAVAYSSWVEIAETCRIELDTCAKANAQNE